MSLKEIKGNQNIIRRLSGAVAAGTVSHAYVLEGEAAGNKLAAAEAFVKAILCPNENGKGDSCGNCPSCKKMDSHGHEDVIYVQAEGGSIKDEAIEALQARLKKKPYVGEHTAAIIENADTMTLRAQNRLLKTLEEPANGTVILLLSENIENLAATILSRCVVYRFSETIAERLPSQEKEVIERLRNAAADVAELILSGKPFYQVAERMNEAASDKERAYLFLDELEHFYRDLIVSGYDSEGKLAASHIELLSDAVEYAQELRRKSRLYEKEAIYRAVSGIEETRRALNRNINVGYALKAMILKGELR